MNILIILNKILVFFMLMINIGQQHMDNVTNLYKNLRHYSNLMGNVHIAWTLYYNVPMSKLDTLTITYTTLYIIEHSTL